MRQPTSVQCGMPAGAPLEPVARIFLSRTITAPTLARLQVERSATSRVIVRKYWCQLSRSLIAVLSSIRSLQALPTFGRLRTLLACVGFDEFKRIRRESHGQRGEEKPP